MVDPALQKEVINLTTKKPEVKKPKPNIFQRGWAALKRGFRWMKNKIKEIFKADDE